MNPVIEVISVGVGLSIQDHGRPGWMRFGVPIGGAMDGHALRVANRLLGNPDGAPALEIVLAGAKLKVLEDTWLAVAGADLGCGLLPWRATRVKAGAVLGFSGGPAGIFSYVAVAGGVLSEQWFGSASADGRNGLGMSLKPGSVVGSVSKSANFSTEGVAGRIALPADRRVYASQVFLDVWRGPQFNLFSAQAQEALVDAAWSVSARSDRTGFRLEGPVLDVPISIPSEPVLPGSFQIPGNGQPIATMVDGPTVGGYAKIAVLPDGERARLAQCAPGTQLSFKWIN